MEWYIYLEVVFVGLMAGFINTLAGGGSALSLPLLIFLGLPPTIANGTNRIAILLQTATASGSFKKEKVLDLKKSWPIGIAALAGAIPGALFAVHLNEFIMRKVIGFILIIVLLLVIFKPEIWIKSREGVKDKQTNWISYLVFFFIGAYGGFIQVGIGFFLLSGLVLVEGLDLLKANAIKSFIVLIYTPLALLIFILNDQVDFKLGLILAVGNVTGAWIGSKLAVSWGTKFIRWVLIVALTGSSLKLLNVF